MSGQRLGGCGKQEPGCPVIGSNGSQGGRGALEFLIAGGLGSQVAAQPVDGEARDRPDRRASLEKRCEEPRGAETMPGDSTDGGDGCRQVGGPPGTAC